MWGSDGEERDVALPAPEAHAVSCDLLSAYRVPTGFFALTCRLPSPILGTRSVARVGLASLRDVENLWPLISVLDSCFRLSMV